MLLKGKERCEQTNVEKEPGREGQMEDALVIPGKKALLCLLCPMKTLEQAEGKGGWDSQEKKFRGPPFPVTCSAPEQLCCWCFSRYLSQSWTRECCMYVSGSSCLLSRNTFLDSLFISAVD